MRGLLLAGLAGVMLAGPVLADERHGYRGARQEYREDRRHDRDGYRDVYRGGSRDGSRDWGRRDYRWSGARVRGPAYVHPRGYGYQPWNIGYRLPPAYHANRYWIGDPGYFRLPPAYRGTRWVRVGSDALLINLRDGYVVQAVRGLYW